MKICGQLVDIHKREYLSGMIIIIRMEELRVLKETELHRSIYIMPGLIDAHIHIESSMITPGAFAIAAVKHGTTAVVSDPHEIANVLGIEGVNL